MKNEKLPIFMGFVVTVKINYNTDSKRKTNSHHHGRIGRSSPNFPQIINLRLEK